MKKVETFWKLQISLKSTPKLSKCVLNMFWGYIFENFLPSFPWKVESSKIFKKIQKFQNSKNAQNRSERYPNVFWTCFGSNFSKNYCPVFHGGSSLRKFSKKKTKNFKVPKKPKIFTKSVQTCFEHVSGQIFPIETFAQCSMEARDF